MTMKIRCFGTMMLVAATLCWISTCLSASASPQDSWTEIHTNVTIREIALDHIGNVVMLGTTGSIGSPVPHLFVHGTNGSLIKVAAALGQNVYESNRLRTDAGGRIYLGSTRAGNLATRCYAPNAASLLWEVSHSTDGRPAFVALEPDNAGNAFVFTSGNDVHGSYRLATVNAVRVSPTNTLELFRFVAFSNISEPYPIARDLTLVATNDVALLWTWGDSNIIVRLNRDGLPRWTSTLALPGERITFRVLEADTEGNLFATGSADGVRSYATAKWDGAGNLLWLNRFTGSSNAAASLGAVDGAVDTNGNFIITGPGGTVSYSSAGRLLWSSRWQGETLKLDESNNAYILGRGPGDTNDTVAKLTTNGVVRWRFALNHENTSISVRAFDVDSSGVVYAGGTRYEGASFQPVTYAARLLEDLSAPAIQVGAAPGVLEQVYGSALQVAVPVTPAPDYSYQWFQDGVPLDGMTNLTIVIPSFQPQHVGAYSLMVRSDNAYVISPEIWVTAAPVLVQPRIDRTSKRRSFVFTADSRYTYEVQATSNFTQWIARMSYHSTNGPVLFSEPRTTEAPEFYRVLMKR